MTEFSEWLAAAQPGESTVYYVGHLGEARQLFLYPEQVAEADDALVAYVRGKVLLTQRPVGPINDQGKHEAFEYIATKARRLDRG